MAKKLIDQIDVSGARVLMRVDFNVPTKDGRITDDRRIVQALPTIRNVLDRGGKAVLMSHLGRPGGSGFEAEYSLKPVARRLGELLSVDAAFADECVGPRADEAVAGMEDGSVLLLENLRFHAAETMIDKARKNPDGLLTDAQKATIEGFARGLSRHGDIYCNDAFGTCHRMHVSMYDVPRLLGKDRSVAGFLVDKEIRYLDEALSRPQRPFVAVLGGAKVGDKIKVIGNLLPKVDALLIGGAMAYTFLASKGISVGASLCERDKLELASELLAAAAGKILLPIDHQCAERAEKGCKPKTVTGAIPDGLSGFDIGPGAVLAYRDALATARTVVWNGPMGMFEVPPFDAGTIAVAHALAEATDRGATTIIGGGDSAAAVEAAGLSERMTHVSTGGGASLEFLEGRRFETLEVLDEA